MTDKSKPDVGPIEQRAPGRPSKFSDHLADLIADEIVDGKSLRTFCANPDMPHRRTVERWLAEMPEFAARYARARECQADVMDEKILEVADACTSETAAGDRVKIDAYKWRASKLAPKRYGDRQEVNHSGGMGLEHWVLDSMVAEKRPKGEGSSASSKSTGLSSEVGSIGTSTK